MNIHEVKKQLDEGSGRLTELDTLLQVMEMAAVVEDSMSLPGMDTDIHWPSIISVARRELAAAIGPLDEAETMLNCILFHRIKKGESA